ncbi:MAG: hypothetical protein IT308_06640 [Anaerolineaceae bacterium]|nr:hypothetical protein [Anaerolineaceae bacterium]
MPERYETHYPRDLGPEFTPQIRQDWRDKLETQKAKVVLMGDSVLFEGIDPVQFETLTGEKPLYVAIPGSSSALWYAIIKNNIVHSAYKPRLLFLFFRDTMLTTPEYRVTGKYFTMLDEFASPADTLITQYAYINSMSVTEKFLERHVPLYGNRTELRGSLEYRLKYTLPYRVLGCGEFCVDQAIADVFSDDKMGTMLKQKMVSEAEDYLYENKNLNFTSQISRSFLPEIIQLLRDNGIQLVLVQVKTMRFDSRSAPILLNGYIYALKNYVHQQNIPYLSFANEERIKDSYFVDQIHLSDEGQKVFTALFSEAVLPMLGNLSIP